MISEFELFGQTFDLDVCLIAQCGQITNFASDFFDAIQRIILLVGPRKRLQERDQPRQYPEKPEEEMDAVSATIMYLSLLIQNIQYVRYSRRKDKEYELRRISEREQREYAINKVKYRKKLKVYRYIKLRKNEIKYKKVWSGYLAEIRGWQQALFLKQFQQLLIGMFVGCITTFLSYKKKLLIRQKTTYPINKKNKL